MADEMSKNLRLALEADEMNIRLKPFRVRAMELVDDADADEIREVYRRIAAHELPHGGFLTKFADAVTNANLENFYQLLPSAYLFACKYNLVEQHRQTKDQTITSFPPDR